MSFWARLLRRWGYVRVADYGLFVGEGGAVFRISDGVIVNAKSVAPPRFRAPPPPRADARSAIPAPLHLAGGLAFSRDPNRADRH